MNYYKKIRKYIFLFSPEFAHKIVILFFRFHLFPRQKQVTSKILENKICNINFPNPIGLAAGFDKNAFVTDYLNKQNFGFIEVGTITPKAQKGNAIPRLFRLAEDEAIINRMGFNNNGKEIALKNIKSRKNKQAILGINIGKNKTSPNDSSDYLTLLNLFYLEGDYITINISSPNTPSLRELQHKELLESFIKEIMDYRRRLELQHNIFKPIFLKIAPDLTEEELKDICELSVKYKVDALIISNTTLSREGVVSSKSNESGGLSGKPLFDKSNKILALAYHFTRGRVPLIGVGGISNASDAYKKIKLGASLVQIYTAIIYQGFDLITEINRELEELLLEDGFKNVKEAIGIDNKIS